MKVKKGLLREKTIERPCYVLLACSWWIEAHEKEKSPVFRVRFRDPCHGDNLCLQSGIVSRNPSEHRRHTLSVTFERRPKPLKKHGPTWMAWGMVHFYPNTPCIWNIYIYILYMYIYIFGVYMHTLTPQNTPTARQIGQSQGASGLCVLEGNDFGHIKCVSASSFGRSHFSSVADKSARQPICQGLPEVYLC